jgi:hypothetical protein
LEGAPEKLRRRIQAVLNLGARRGFDQGVLAQEIAYQVGKGQREIRSRSGGLFTAEMQEVEGQIGLYVGTMVSAEAMKQGESSPLAKRVRRGGGDDRGVEMVAAFAVLGENPRGIDTTQAEAFYGIIRGFARYVESHPETHEVRIHAGKVVNERLRQSLLDLGFQDDGNHVLDLRIPVGN